MSSVARRTVQHAYEDLGLGTDAVAMRTRRRSRRRSVLPQIFGDSRATNWGAIVLIGLLLLLLVRPMIMSLMSYHRTHSLLAERRAEVVELQQRTVELDRQLEYYRTDAFVAERARQYGLVKPGEQPFVVRELARPESISDHTRTRIRNATAVMPGQTGASSGAADEQ